MSPAMEAVLWWERHRIAFNIVLLVTGIVSGTLTIWIGSHAVVPGEDFIEPLAVLFGALGYAVAANAFYCLGWISEILWSGGDTSRTASLRARVFRWGTSFSVAVTLVPVVIAVVAWARAR